jgi:CO/xanthine dehydrogenase FAD-binding subunit
MIHAGGIDLANRMKRGAVPEHVVTLGQIPDLCGIQEIGGRIEIGAATRHWEIENDPMLRCRLPMVAGYIAGLGNIRIRMQGTIGGNIMAGEPGYEMLPLLAVLGADLVFADWSTGGQEITAAREWVLPRASSSKTLLLTSIRIPLRPITVAWNRELRPALGLVASLEWSGDRVLHGAAAVIGDHRGPMVREHHFTEALPAADAAPRAANIAEVWADKFPDVDVLGGPDRDYCRHVLSVMLRRVLHTMLKT